MNKAIIFSIMLIFVVTSGAYTGGRKQQEKRDMQRYSESRTRKWQIMSRKLDLSESQRQKIRDQRERNTEKKNEYVRKLGDLRNILRKKLSEEEIDVEEVEYIIEDIGEVHKKILGRRVQMLIEFKSVLNDEQWKKVRRMKAGSFIHKEKKK